VGHVVLTAIGLYVIVLLRAGGTYAVGRLASAGAQRSRFAARMATPRFQRAERAIQRWGAPVVAVSFLTVGFQTAANFIAGTVRMPLPRYLPALFVGGAAWALIYAWLGVAALKKLAGLFADNAALAVGLVAVALLAVGGVVMHRRRALRGTADDT
jgi:membrane protein DedA with SNARE-associated domain